MAVGILYEETGLQRVVLQIVEVCSPEIGQIQSESILAAFVRSVDAVEGQSDLMTDMGETVGQQVGSVTIIMYDECLAAASFFGYGI